MFVLERLRHWFENASEQDAEKVLYNFQKAKSFVPAHTQTAYLKAVSNAWATSTRHGHSDVKCIFGCHDAKDSFTHYMICPVLTTPLSKLVPEVGTISSQKQCLGLLANTSMQSLIAVIALDCFHYTYNTISHATTTNKWPSAAKHMRERFLNITSAPRI